MSDKQPTRPLAAGDAPAPEPSSLKGLTMALGIGPAESGQDPILGRDIGGVTIVRLIAEGGMGRVYEGRQEKPKRTVAVKVMRPGLTSPSVLKRFEYEAEVLGRLQHPGIAHIYSVGVHQMGGATVPYFVMEYIADARTLTKYADDLKLPTRQRLDLFRSVCDAVAHGHQKGVIHRDLKPSNILVDATGQPKVIDFGVARATDSDMALTTMQTDVGQLIGTLQYMSPEQFKADPNDIDVRSDVYALGVILYELLAGKMPYDVKKKAIHEVARIVQEDDPTPLSSFNRALKGDVAVIAGKCLEKDRGRRYSSASELGSDIGRFLTGEPISASPPGFVDGLRRLARRHRVAAAATAAVFGALVIAVIGIGIFAGRADEARRRAEAAQLVAEQQRANADDQRRQAERAKATALAAEAQAKQEKAEATRRLYEANVYRLQQLVKEQNVGVGKPLLRELTAGFTASTLPIELGCLGAQLDQAIAVCEGHGGQIVRIAYSPDGSRLATGSFDNTIRLWDAATGEHLATLEGHRDTVLPVAFSPDSAMLATGSADKTVRLWDAATGKPLAILRGHEDRTVTVCFSPDGAKLATGSWDKTMRLWDVRTGKQTALYDKLGDAVIEVAFSPDGTKLAAAGNKSGLWLWDAATGGQIAHWDQGFACDIEFSSDGSKLAVADGPGDVHVLDAATAKPLSLLKGPDLISILSFSPDCLKLATSSAAGTFLWDVDTGKQIATFDARGTPLAFSPDGKVLVTADCFQTSVRLWDTATGKQLAVLGGHRDRIVAIMFSPDGTSLATGSVDATARLWAVQPARQLWFLDGQDDSVDNVQFSPDGTRLATYGGSGSYTGRIHQDGTTSQVYKAGDKNVRIWDVATGTSLVSLKGDGTRIQSLAFSPDGTALATGDLDGTVRLWDAVIGRHRATLKGHAKVASKLRFSADGKRLVTGSWDKVLLWDVGTAAQVAELATHDGKVALNHDGSTLATGSDDGSVRLLDVVTATPLCLLAGHDTAVDYLSFSKDGRRLATHASNKTVFWDIGTGKQIASIDTVDRPISFSPDGTRFVTGTAGDLAIWNATNGNQVAQLKGHAAQVSAVDYSPDGTRIASCGYDGTMRLWDSATGKQLAVLEGCGELRNVSFHPDGTRLASGSDDGIACLWGVSNAELHRARLETRAMERRLDEKVTAWLKKGPEAAVARLRQAQNDLSPDDYRVAGNMLLKACSGGGKKTTRKRK